MTAIKTLLLGWSEGNLADTFRAMLVERLGSFLVYMPSKDELDLRDSHAIEKYITRNGPFDEIVYCAAVNRLAWLEDITRSRMEQVFRVNYFAWVDVISSHLAHFPDSRFRAVVVSSDAAKVPMRGSLMYNSSKAALQFSVRNMARELAPNNIVVGVAPCIIEDTPMTDYIDEAIPGFRDWTSERAREYERSNIPLGRRLTKDEVAQCMMFALTGPEGLTGSTIEITGGK